MDIRTFQAGDEEAIIRLWDRCDLLRSWNDPVKDIARKIREQPDRFLVGRLDGRIVATVMVGYDGHRGWMYYLGVDPDYQRRGLARLLMVEAERLLLELGCPKISLQIRRDNLEAIGFYESIGFSEDAVVNFGKRLIPDE